MTGRGSHIRFVLGVTLAHVVTYFVTGGLFYAFLTKPLYEGPDPLFAVFMRSPADPEGFAHISRWFLPAQLLRGVLIGVALQPFRPALAGWSFGRRFGVLFLLSVVFLFWATAVAAPGTIEGLVYLRPEFDLGVHARVQPELLVQLTLFSLWVARWARA
jgi:hypothetical protein